MVTTWSKLFNGWYMLVLVLISTQTNIQHIFVECWFRFRHEPSIGFDFDFDPEGSRVHMLVSKPNQPVSHSPAFNPCQELTKMYFCLLQKSIHYIANIIGFDTLC